MLDYIRKLSLCCTSGRDDCYLLVQAGLKGGSTLWATRLWQGVGSSQQAFCIAC